MSKKSSNLLRSNSYYNMLRPYLSDCHKYATCPPINLQQLSRQTAGATSIIPNTMLKITSNNNLTTSTNNKKFSANVNSNSNSNSNSMRAFNFNVNPLWRHTKMQHFELQRRDNTKHNNNNTSSNHHHHNGNHKQHKHCLHLHQHQHNKSKSNLVKNSTRPELPGYRQKHDSGNGVIAKSIILQREQQKSLPVFEVLPPLWMGNATAAAASSPGTNTVENLIYQNSYLLDGVAYDYNASETELRASGKFRMDYMKLLKRITTNSKPSDRDVIFGNAKILLAKTRGWDSSRIDWLLELERRQEFRRKRELQHKLQQQQQQRKHKNKLNTMTIATTTMAAPDNIEAAAAATNTVNNSSNNNCGAAVGDFEVDDDDYESRRSLFNFCCFPFPKNALIWRHK